MGSVTRILRDFITVTVESVVEAGSPILRRDLYRTACLATILLAAVFFLLAAAGIALGGVYLLLVPHLGPTAAIFLCSAISLLCGLLMVLWARSKAGFR